MAHAAADAVLNFLRQPEDPLMPVVALSGLILGVAVARTHNDLVAFYKWFRSSGFEMAKYRGYGQSACKLWGTHAHVTNIRARASQP